MFSHKPVSTPEQIRAVLEYVRLTCTDKPPAWTEDRVRLWTDQLQGYSPLALMAAARQLCGALLPDRDTPRPADFRKLLTENPPALDPHPSELEGCTACRGDGTRQISQWVYQLDENGQVARQALDARGNPLALEPGEELPEGAVLVSALRWIPRTVIAACDCPKGAAMAAPRTNADGTATRSSYVGWREVVASQAGKRHARLFVSGASAYDEQQAGVRLRWREEDLLIGSEGHNALSYVERHGVALALQRGETVQARPGGARVTPNDLENLITHPARRAM